LEDFETRFTNARPPASQGRRIAYRYVYICISKTPCGRVPPPPSLRDTFIKLDAKPLEKSFDKLLYKYENWSPKLEKWKSGGGLGVLGSESGMKILLRLSLPILAGLGTA
jgi:hypothetical protein